MTMKFGNYDDECREVFVEKDELKCSMRKNVESNEKPRFFTLSTLIISVICGILIMYLYILAKQGKSCDAKLRGPKSFLIHGSQLHRSGYISSVFISNVAGSGVFLFSIFEMQRGKTWTCRADNTWRAEL